MIITCPKCQQKFSFDEAELTEIQKQIAVHYKLLGHRLRSLVREYVKRFMTGKTMTPDKQLRLLKEIAQMLNDGHITYNRRTYFINPVALEEALRQVCNRVKRLTNHNYLNVVLIDLMEKAGGKFERQHESRRRGRPHQRSQEEGDLQSVGDILDAMGGGTSNDTTNEC